MPWFSQCSFIHFGVTCESVGRSVGRSGTVRYGTVTVEYGTRHGNGTRYEIRVTRYEYEYGTVRIQRYEYENENANRVQRTETQSNGSQSTEVQSTKYEVTWNEVPRNENREQGNENTEETEKTRNRVPERTGVQGGNQENTRGHRRAQGEQKGDTRRIHGGIPRG